MDQSEVGMAKLRQWAAEEGLSDRVTTHVADLAEFDMGPNHGFDLIVSIFAHTPPDVRGPLHARVARALRPGGWFILEAYHPANSYVMRST